MTASAASISPQGQPGQRRYLVVTPAYERYACPPEYGCDVVEVMANTKRQAKVQGLRELRRTHSRWIQDQDGCPFTGLEVHDMESDE